VCEAYRSPLANAEVNKSGFIHQLTMWIHISQIGTTGTVSMGFKLKMKPHGLTLSSYHFRVYAFLSSHPAILPAQMMVMKNFNLGRRG
jgi:hypothetical protein